MTEEQEKQLIDTLNTALNVLGNDAELKKKIKEKFCAGEAASELPAPAASELPAADVNTDVNAASSSDQAADVNAASSSGQASSSGPTNGGRRRSKRRNLKKSGKKSKKGGARKSNKGGRSRKNCGSKNRRKLSRRR
jgi:hypothetical protein